MIKVIIKPKLKEMLYKLDGTLVGPVLFLLMIILLNL